MEKRQKVFRGVRFLLPMSTTRCDDVLREKKGEGKNSKHVLRVNFLQQLEDVSQVYGVDDSLHLTVAIQFLLM